MDVKKRVDACLKKTKSSKVGLRDSSSLPSQTLLAYSVRVKQGGTAHTPLAYRGFLGKSTLVIPDGGKAARDWEETREDGNSNKGENMSNDASSVSQSVLHEVCNKHLVIAQSIS